MALPLPALPDVVDADEAGSHSTIVRHAETRPYPPVAGDGHHYIFKHAGMPVQMPAIKVHEFKDGIFSIDVSRVGLTNFYVFDSARRCVKDLSWGIAPFISDDAMSFSDPIAILDDSFSGTMNICHFLLDKLTRISLYETLNIPNLKFLMTDRFLYYETVAAFPYLHERIIFTDRKRLSIRPDRLIVSSNIRGDFRHPAHFCAPWAIGFLRSMFDGPCRPARKLFISRTDATGRSVLNWAEVQTALAEFGFEPVVLGALTLQEQIDLFRQASHVVGVHGAGLTNILFAAESCRVLEIVPPLVATNAYWLLASALGQQYSCMIATDPWMAEPDYTAWNHDARFNTRDIILPIEKLRAALERMG